MFGLTLSPGIPPLAAPVVVRHANPRDEPAVLAIAAAAGQPHATATGVAGVLSGPGRMGMVAEIDGRVVGYMAYGLFPRHYRLHVLVVHPHHRRKGVGRALARYLRGRLAKTGRRHAEADAPAADLDAHLFLRATGWRATGVDREADTYRFELTTETIR